jgi:hypothetical protein
MGPHVAPKLKLGLIRIRIPSIDSCAFVSTEMVNAHVAFFVSSIMRSQRRKYKMKENQLLTDQMANQAFIFFVLPRMACHTSKNKVALELVAY